MIDKIYLESDLKVYIWNAVFSYVKSMYNNILKFNLKFDLYNKRLIYLFDKKKSHGSANVVIIIRIQQFIGCKVVYTTSFWFSSNILKYLFFLTATIHWIGWK